MLINDSQIKYEMIEKTEETEDYMRKGDINKTCSGGVFKKEDRAGSRGSIGAGQKGVHKPRKL